MAGLKYFRFNAIPTQINANSYTQSPPTELRNEDNVGMQWNVTGTPTGTIALQGSIDWNPSPPAPSPGNGNFITIQSIPIAAAVANLGNFPTLGALFIRALWTPTGTGVQTITTVADSAKSLAGAYFLITDEASAHKYAIWFKVSGTGSAPVVSGYTAEEVDISTNDTAAAVATAAAAVIAGLTGFASAVAVGAVITVTNTSAGPFVPARDGLAPLATNFTFAVTAGGGTINVWLSGKSI